MPRDEELPIIRAFYDFVLWLNPKIAKFPRDQRFVLGERMERQLYEVLENLIRAKYTRSRRGILDQVNLDLEILRFQIRLAKDQHCLSLKSYGAVYHDILHFSARVVATIVALPPATPHLGGFQRRLGCKRVSM